MEQNPSTPIILQRNQKPLDAPPEAADPSAMELVRMWRLKSPEDRELISTMIRPTYDDPLMWGSALASLARNVAASYSTDDPNKPEIEIRKDGAELLRKGIEILVGPEPVKRHAPTTTAISTDAEIAMPEDIYQHADNRQVLNIWGIPAIDQCADCGTAHEADHYIGVDFAGFTPYHIGEMLAHSVIIFMQHSQTDKTKRFKLTGEIQKAFFETLNGTVEGRA